jgi:hypothetical protein
MPVTIAAESLTFPAVPAIIAIVVAVVALAVAGLAVRRAGALEQELERERRRSGDGGLAPRLEMRDVAREGDELVLSLVNSGGAVAFDVASLLAVRDREVKHPDRVEVRPRASGHGPVQLRFPLPDPAAGTGVPAFFLRLRYEGPAGQERAAIGYQPTE